MISLKVLRAVMISIFVTGFTAGILPFGCAAFQLSEETENLSLAEPELPLSAESILAGVRSLQTYYVQTQVARSSTRTAEVVAGPRGFSRKAQNELVFRSGAKTAAGIGQQAREIIAANQISYSDYSTLLHIVEAEATAGDEYSKMLIAAVVLNRVKDSHFPDSITEVVWERSDDGSAQFSPTADGRIQTVTVSESTRSAVRRVLEGEDPSQGALFFVARETASPDSVYWFDSQLAVLYAYGGHDFFTYKEYMDE